MHYTVGGNGTAFLRLSEPSKTYWQHLVVVASDDSVGWYVTTRGIRADLLQSLCNRLPILDVYIAHQITESSCSSGYPLFK